MITTIQIHEEVKKELENLKESNTESYEDVILGLIYEVEKKKRYDKKLMIEGCNVMAEDSLKTVKEWEPTELDWVWNSHQSFSNAQYPLKLNPRSILSPDSL